jgi:hypothetical protein
MGPESEGPASGRVAADLARVIAAVADGRIEGRVTKVKIREYLRCGNPHATAVNAQYQQHRVTTKET